MPIVVDDEEQYSTRPAGRDDPAGWSDEGRTGPNDRGPALRATLVRSGEERHVLLAAHRIVAGRASLTVLEHEPACP
ncbi:MbtH family NRPS accessory protein [Streptomyces sp. NPDC016626]|uniref:MbtH family NRPS accessory protein n=1 Tax=Streptomyces sp. NPDC016626 TaxID=3364968 RepID=UPI0036F550C1